LPHGGGLRGQSNGLLMIFKKTQSKFKTFCYFKKILALFYAPFTGAGYAAYF